MMLPCNHSHFFHVFFFKKSTEWKGTSDTSDGAEQARNDQLLEEISTLVPLLGIVFKGDS